MKYIAALFLMILLSGCQSMPPSTSNNSINPALCEAPQYLTATQKRLCENQKKGLSPAYQQANLPKEIKPHQLTAKQIAIIKSTVANGLKDPTSAIFGDIKAAKSDDQHIAVCGMVNAKNSFGGYVGSRPFVGGLNGDMFTIKIMDTGATVSQMIINECAKYNIAPNQ